MLGILKNLFAKDGAKDGAKSGTKTGITAGNVVVISKEDGHDLTLDVSGKVAVIGALFHRDYAHIDWMQDQARDIAEAIQPRLWQAPFQYRSFALAVPDDAEVTGHPSPSALLSALGSQGVGDHHLMAVNLVTVSPNNGRTHLKICFCHAVAWHEDVVCLVNGDAVTAWSFGPPESLLISNDRALFVAGLHDAVDRAKSGDDRGVRAIEAALRHRAGGRPLRYWMPDPSGLVERQGSEALAAPERLKAMMAEGCLLADIGTVQNLLSATAAFHGFDKVADLIEHAYATHGDRTGSEMQLAYSHLHQSIVLAHARGARSFTEELADERQGQKAAPRPEPGPKPAKAAPAKERQEPDGTLVQQDLAETHYETPKAAAEGTGEHMEEKDDNLHYAEVSLRVSPLPTGRGLRIVDRTKPDGRIKSLREVPAKGAESSAKYGVNWSFPVSDALVEILKVKFEKGSEGFGAYHTAAFNAFQQAIKATGVRFMEPVGQVRIHLQDPTEGNIGGAQVVIGKVRGATDVREDRDDGWTLTCVAPLAERKRIDGGLEHLKLDPSRCLFEMTPCGHAPLPQDLEAAVLSAERERVIAAAQKK